MALVKTGEAKGKNGEFLNNHLIKWNRNLNISSKISNSSKSATQAVLENHSKSGFHTVLYCNASKSPQAMNVK
jgi:hypothetical protein